MTGPPVAAAHASDVGALQLCVFQEWPAGFEDRSGRRQRGAPVVSVSERSGRGSNDCCFASRETECARSRVGSVARRTGWALPVFVRFVGGLASRRVRCTGSPRDARGDYVVLCHGSHPRDCCCSALLCSYRGALRAVSIRARSRSLLPTHFSVNVAARGFELSARRPYSLPL